MVQGLAVEIKSKNCIVMVAEEGPFKQLRLSLILQTSHTAKPCNLSHNIEPCANKIVVCIESTSRRNPRISSSSIRKACLRPGG